MRYISLFEKFTEQRSILIIVDVQKSFKKYFSDKFYKAIVEYSKKFDQVYQIFDNHHQGGNVERDYLYDSNPNLDDESDLFEFPNQVDVIEKRYNYDVDADFYKKILSKETLREIKNKGNSLKKGEYFSTTEGTIIVYIGNNHKWFHVPKKLYELFKKLKEAQSGNTDITIVGGASGECLEDIITTAKSMGLVINKNKELIYSAQGSLI